MAPGKKLINIVDPRLREIMQDPEQRMLYFPVRTVAVERRFMQYIIDILPVLLASMIFGRYSSVTQNLLIFYPLYYFVSEAFFGTTIGKKIMHHKLVDAYGQEPSLPVVFMRSIFRLIPLEPFSCIADRSRGWHDILSGTFVIPEAEYYRIKYSS
jgi:uncharacterized RDD family membrane protein YckC